MKHKTIWITVFGLVVLFSSAIGIHISEEPVTPAEPEVKMAIPEAEEAFHKMMDVLEHQRCVNCHPSDNVPKQSEDRHPHHLGITRTNGAGSATNCQQCHADSNNEYSGVPGAPHWALAPPSMAWEGLSRYEIARSMMDRSKNGNRSADDIMHHLTEHELVLWAWEPGVDSEGNPREIPPVGKEEYIEAVKTWIDAGAIIPDENTKD